MSVHQQECSTCCAVVTAKVLAERLVSECLVIGSDDNGNELANTAEAEAIAEDVVSALLTREVNDDINNSAASTTTAEALDEAAQLLADYLMDGVASLDDCRKLLLAASDNKDDIDDDSDSRRNDESDKYDDDDEYHNYDHGKDYCELCERTQVRLTKHHLIPKATWTKTMKPRIRRALNMVYDQQRTQRLLKQKKQQRLAKQQQQQQRGSSTTSYGGNIHYDVDDDEEHAIIMQIATTVLHESWYPTLLNEYHTHRDCDLEKKDATSSSSSQPVFRVEHFLHHEKIAWVCRPYHSAIHSNHPSNIELALELHSIDLLLEHSPAVYKFAQWQSKQQR